jgi:HAD superfamily hydrolase (TIGR01509 family)
VRALDRRGLALAVTSSAVGAEIDAILRRLQLRDAFALIVDGSQVARAKPAPEAYLVTANKLGVAPRDCVVFEDSHVGVLAAKAAQMTCIAVRSHAARMRQDLAAADVVLESFCEIDVSA